MIGKGLGSQPGGKPDGLEARSFSSRKSSIGFRTWYAAAALLILALPVAAIWRVRSLRSSAVAYWEAQLSSIADLTAFAIRGWVQDRTAESRELASLLAGYPELFEPGEGVENAVRLEASRKKLLPYLQLVKRQNGYEDIWVTGRQDQVLLSSAEGIQPDDRIRNVGARAAREGKYKIIGPRLDSRGIPLLTFAYPIPAPESGIPTADRKSPGALILTVNPSTFLFPLVSVDTVPTGSGECILIERSDDELRVLSPLRHPPAPALSIRMPWNAVPEIGRKAIEQESAVGEFQDLRGVKVIAAARHISGTVGLIRQIDQSEAFALYRTQIRTEGLLAFSVLVAFSFAFFAFRRKERTSRLREIAASEARLAGIINTAMDGIIALDAELRITIFNAAAERMFQYSSEEALGSPGSQLLPKRLRRNFQSAADRFVDSPEVAVAIPDSADLSGLRRNGEEFPLEASVSKLELGDEKIYLALVRDVTTRKEAEDRLTRAEEKYHRLFEESRDTVFISSVEGRFLDINAAGLDLFGFDSKEELLQIDIGREFYFHPEERDEIRRTQEIFGYVKDYEIAVRRRNGQKRIVQETSNAVRDEKGNVIAYRGILRDVTEQKSLERQLIQSQKMEAVGQLAGGIAHDFNNILTAILGYAEFLQSELPAGDTHRHDVDEIARAATRASSLTRQLLAYSRRQVMQPKPLGLNSLVSDMDKMLRRLITENIELDTHLQPDLGLVMADPAQIEQVILNLVVNARDAMSEGGKLTIQTGNVNLSGTLPAQPLDVPAGRYVSVSVGDTGHGMDAEVQSRIFEPFFTTKEIGKGTGLGLSTVYGIVKQSGGYITVRSDVGEGTVFTVYLPKGEIAASPVEGADGRSRSLEGSETVLLVEDETAVRSLARDILTRHKYRVIEAANGEEALVLSRDLRDRIHLMVTDMIMPQMGGRQLAREMAVIHPETRVLFISGYADSEVAGNEEIDPGASFLDKPFKPLELVRMVRSILDKTPGGKAEKT